jgi:hypothetical protein
MSIYGLFSGCDGESHLCPLQIAGQGPAMNQLLPCNGWRPFQHQVGVRQDFHPTPVSGMTLLMDGCMEIEVRGGTLHRIHLGKGDMLLVIDTRGAGHATAITGTEMLRGAGVSFGATDWPAVRDTFTGWPDGLLSP